MPSLPVQLVILRRLTNHLAGMSVSGGYDFDLDGKVFRGRTLVGDSDGVPCVTILEAPESAAGNAGGIERMTRNTRWRLLIQGFVADDRANPTDPAYVLKANVERRLSEVSAVAKSGLPAFPAIYRLGGLIAEMFIENGIVRPPQKDVSDKAFFALPVTITFASDATAPLMEVADVDNP